MPEAFRLLYCAASSVAREHRTAEPIGETYANGMNVDIMVTFGVAVHGECEILGPKAGEPVFNPSAEVWREAIFPTGAYSPTSQGLANTLSFARIKHRGPCAHEGNTASGVEQRISEGHTQPTSERREPARREFISIATNASVIAFDPGPL